MVSIESGRGKLVDTLVSNSFTVHPVRPLGPDNLPRKYMPPRNFSDLYRLYQAERFAAGEPVASPSTFFRVASSSGWYDKIRFRSVSNHAQCSTCHRLKANIRRAKDISSHAKYADKYMRHLAGVFADRAAYEQLKSRAIMEKDILCLIIDSMDKSKFSLPRYSQGVVPKAMEMKKRPDVELTATIVHGRGIYLWITDPEQSVGSDWTQECLTRSLDKAFKKSQAAGESWPRVLRIWSDNTCKETLTLF